MFAGGVMLHYCHTLCENCRNISIVA